MSNKRAIYRISIGYKGWWEGMDAKSASDNSPCFAKDGATLREYQKFIDTSVSNIFTPRLEAYAETVGADLVELTSLEYDTPEIAKKTWIYNAACTMKIYALKDAYEKGYEEFLLVDHDIFIARDAGNIFEEVKEDGFYMLPHEIPNKGYLDITKRHYGLDLTQTWNGGVILAKGKAMSTVAKNIPYSMYAFLDRITWSKGYPFKVGNKKDTIDYAEGFAANDEIVYPYLAFDSGEGVKDLNSKWNFLVYGLNDEMWDEADRVNFLHFVGPSSKKAFEDKDFVEKFLSIF